MNKKHLFQYLSIILLAVFSMQSHAVKPFTVTCGDGEKIEVSDSEYHPSGIGLACLSAGHKPPIPSQASPKRKTSLSLKKTSVAYKTFNTQYLKRLIAKDTGGNAAQVDHSDIILMLQGCKCISPSCVAYRCPADVDVP